MEQCIFYQISCNVLFKWFKINLGPTLANKIKHQNKINNEVNGNLQEVDGNNTNELKTYLNKNLNLQTNEA